MSNTEFTLQEKALMQIQKLYGMVFTEDHINYRRVGFRRGGETISAIGNNWQQAIERLARKAAGR